MVRNCEIRQYTIKVTEGNAWQLLLQLKTKQWESERPIQGDIDLSALTDIVVTVDGMAWTDWVLDEQGVMLNIPATMPLCAHSVVLTADYAGVAIRAAYYEAFTIVPWSYADNVENYIPTAPEASEMAYIYVGAFDDQELEELKRQYRLKIAEAQAAIAAANAAKEDFDEKAEALDEVATKTDLADLATKQDLAGLAEKTDLAGLATAQNVTDAKNEILAALPQEASAEFIQSLFANES